jgi:hypothetical protein
MSWTWRDVVVPIIVLWTLAQFERWDAGHDRPTPLSGAAT